MHSKWLHYPSAQSRADPTCVCQHGYRLFCFTHWIEPRIAIWAASRWSRKQTRKKTHEHSRSQAFSLASQEAFSFSTSDTSATTQWSGVRTKTAGPALLFSRFSFWQIQTERILKNKTVETHSYEWVKGFSPSDRSQTGSMGQKREEKSGPKILALAMQSTMPTLHRRCAQAAHTHTHRLHTRRTRWRTYSRSSRSTRSRNFKESFRAILEGFRNALQSKQVHNSRNFKGQFQSKNSQRQIQTERILRNKTP